MVLIPVIRQVSDPAAAPQTIVLPAALAAEPTAALIDDTEPDGYEIAHSSPTGAVPEFDIETARLAVPPGLTVADERLRLVCAVSWGQTTRPARSVVRIKGLPIVARTGPWLLLLTGE